MYALIGFKIGFMDFISMSTLLLRGKVDKHKHTVTLNKMYSDDFYELVSYSPSISHSLNGLGFNLHKLGRVEEANMRSQLT